MSKRSSESVAKNRWQRDFPGFRLRLTRWGGVFLVLVLVLAFAAVNTGNNALMAVLGVALGSYVVSGTWSRQVLGKVSASVKRPAEIFAGRPARFEVELRNASRFFPAYGLVIRSESGDALLVEPLLQPGQTVQRTVSDVFPQRGWRDLASWRLEVVLPLGFFVKSKQVLAGDRVLVYPRLQSGPTRSFVDGSTSRGSEGFAGRGREGEVFQLRDFQEGDEQRQVHWKQTAKQRRMISVDRRRIVERPVVLRLDPTVEDLRDRGALESFERRVSAVATAVLHRLERGEPVAVAVGETLYPQQNARSAARELLEPLSVVAPRLQGAG